MVDDTEGSQTLEVQFYFFMGDFAIPLNMVVEPVLFTSITKLHFDKIPGVNKMSYY